MKNTVLFILLWVVCACSGSEEGNFEMIDLRDALAQAGELTVKDLGEHVSYVPLETTDESLIGKKATVRIVKDKLLVGSFEQPIKMFDKKTGKFIRTVGNIGQGANEYTLLEKVPVFWTDDARDIIYVKTDEARLLRFDVEGNPLPSVYLPEGFPHVRGFSQITTENKLYVYNQTLFNENDYKIFVYDFDNEGIQKYFLSEDEVIPLELTHTPLVSDKFGNIPVSTNTIVFPLQDGRIMIYHTEEPALWVFDREIYFKENFNDTIYQFSGNEFIPRIVFNLGDKRFVYKDKYKIEGSQNKIVINYILEGKNSLFFAFQTDYYKLDHAKTYLGVYNKKDKSVKVTDKIRIEDPANGFFDGKLQTATSDGQLAGLMDAASFMETMNSKNIFAISEEDNPVVIIIE